MGTARSYLTLARESSSSSLSPPFVSTTGVMKAPPTESDEHIISNSTADAPDSDDGQDETQPHSPSRQGDFSEYLWMANEEEFEEQIMHELEEEALMQQCMEAMQEEMNSVGPMPGGIFSNGNNHTEDHLARGIQNLAVNDNSAAQSKLNPDAAEFVPRFSTSTATTGDGNGAKE